MMRPSTLTRLLGAVLLLAASALAALPARAEPVLRPAVTVDGDVIRLGDLFAGAGAHATDVVAPAPPPGSRTLFDAAWLAATAREHQLDWQPASSFDQASVERATRVIGSEAVTQSLLAAIGRSQSITGARLQLDNAGFHLLVPASAPAGLDVEGLTVDARSGRFSATVAAPGGGSAPTPVTGRLVRMVKLPVLDRPVAPGEIIAQGDITSLEVASERVTPETVLSASDLVGKTPRQTLRAGQPLLAGDVHTPIVVHKDDLVLVVLETPSMRLTTQAKALDDGGTGAVIRVANTKSNRVIEARVVGPNLVAVTPTAQLAARAEEVK